MKFVNTWFIYRGYQCANICKNRKIRVSRLLGSVETQEPRSGSSSKKFGRGAKRRDCELVESRETTRREKNVEARSAETVNLSRLAKRLVETKFCRSAKCRDCELFESGEATCREKNCRGANRRDLTCRES